MNIDLYTMIWGFVSQNVALKMDVLMKQPISND